MRIAPGARMVIEIPLLARKRIKASQRPWFPIGVSSR